VKRKQTVSIAGSVEEKFCERIYEKSDSHDLRRPTSDVQSSNPKEKVSAFLVALTF